MRERTIKPAAAEAELVKVKRVLRFEKKKARRRKASRLERANVQRTIQTLAVGVKAVEKLRDVAEKLEVKRERSAKMSSGSPVG